MTDMIIFWILLPSARWCMLWTRLYKQAGKEAQGMISSFGNELSSARTHVATVGLRSRQRMLWYPRVLPARAISMLWFRW